MNLPPGDDTALVTCATGKRVERVLMEYRGIRFELDLIGLDTWRWTVHTDAPSGFRLIGQFRGQRDAAITHSRSVIDDHHDRNGGRGDA